MNRRPLEPIAYNMPDTSRPIATFQSRCPHGLTPNLGWSVWQRKHQAIAWAHHWSRIIMVKQTSAEGLNQDFHWTA